MQIFLVAFVTFAAFVAFVAFVEFVAFVTFGAFVEFVAFVAFVSFVGDQHSMVVLRQLILLCSLCLKPITSLELGASR